MIDDIIDQSCMKLQESSKLRKGKYSVLVNFDDSLHLMLIRNIGGAK